LTATLTRRAPTPMTREEARRCCDSIKHRLDDIRRALLELYERKGWQVLGYPSWRECCTEEFELTQRRVYQLLTAAEIERDICTTVQIGEYTLRPLGQLDSPEDRKEAWDMAAASTARAVPTAAEVREAIRKLKLNLSADEQAQVARVIDAAHLEADARRRKRVQQETVEEALTRGVTRLRQAARAFRKVPGAGEVLALIAQAAGLAASIDLKAVPPVADALPHGMANREQQLVGGGGLPG
jgi:hypothetical protein